MARKKKQPELTRAQQLTAVAESMQHWEPAHTVLTDVVAQPTPFPQFNVASGVGGWPLQRPCLIHGPSNHGKTQFLHGVGKAFLEAGHFYNLVDAEMTTPQAWLQQLMNQWAKSPGFRALRPRSYEQTCDAVRSAADALATARSKGQLPEDVTMFFGIDSIRKLNPERLMDKIADKGATGKKGSSIDGAGGRAAQYKAALNAQWLDELVPLLYHANAAMAFIGREAANTEIKGPYDRTWKLTGGGALFFDSSLVIRVVLAGQVYKGSKENRRMIGERHRLEIHKTKIANKDNKIVMSYYHTSNGALHPAGFDRGRDVLEMALATGVIEKKGTRYWEAENGEFLPDTEVGAAVHLATEHALRERIEAMSLDTFVPHEEDADQDTDDSDIVTTAGAQ